MKRKGRAPARPAKKPPNLGAAFGAFLAAQRRVHVKRSRASKRGWQTRREREHLAPFLGRLLRAQQEAAPASFVKRLHARWYDEKLAVENRVGRSRYADIVRQIGQSYSLSNVESYVES